MRRFPSIQDVTTGGFRTNTKTARICAKVISLTLMLSIIINPFPNKPWFLCVCSTSNFSFSHSVFYPFGKLSVIFIKFEFVVCKVFKFGRVYNLSFGLGKG